MTTVRIIEWMKRTGPFSRFAAECFKDCGCKVETTTNWADTGGAIDLVYTPVPGLEKKGVPLLTQFEGYGGVSILPSSKASPKIAETFKNSDKVILADPNIFAELARCGIDQPTIMLPNPAPNVTIPPKDSPNYFTVFCPQGVWKIKHPGRVIDAAKMVEKEEPKIRFVMPVGSERVWRCPLNWLDVDNVEFLPTLPYPRMLEEYAKASIIASFSAVEVLPWTIFEGLISGKPLIADCLGKVQSVNRKYVEDMVSWFGTPSRIFNEKWRDKYGSGEGNHYLHAGSAEELAELILELYHDEKRRYELGNNALEWVNAYSNDWKPRDKGERILRLVGLR